MDYRIDDANSSNSNREKCKRGSELHIVKGDLCCKCHGLFALYIGRKNTHKATTPKERINLVVRQASRRLSATVADT